MTGGYWLWQHDDAYAHAYPEDDDEGDEPALCGHRLRFECGECGQGLKVHGGHRKQKCGACQKKLLHAPQPKPEGG